ncbi:MAG: hypothetical protein AMJ73_00900 [candidate division Zixibacteria bacterium SM1_73]|nr:MAG: hypothetical protein AMJ73_00900 [candidate division Zixibacteria bacterium SM1_73]
MLMIRALSTLRFPSTSIWEIITAEEIWQEKTTIKKVRMKKIFLSICLLPKNCTLEYQASARLIRLLTKMNCFGPPEECVEKLQLTECHSTPPLVCTIRFTPKVGEESPYKSKRFFGRPHGLPQNDRLAFSTRTESEHFNFPHIKVFEKLIGHP